VTAALANAQAYLADVLAVLGAPPEELATS